MKALDGTDRHGPQPSLRVTHADIDHYLRNRAGSDDIRQRTRELRKLTREVNRIRRAGDRAAMAALAQRILSVTE